MIIFYMNLSLTYKYSICNYRALRSEVIVKKM